MFFSVLQEKATVPDNDGINTAANLTNVTAYCSSDATYSNADATSSGFKKGNFWITEGKDVWFKSTAINTDVNIVITGAATGNTNTLTSPLAAIYTVQTTTLTEVIGSMNSSNNLTTAYKGGLTIGMVYYIRVSAENNATGSFKMCVNNYNPPQKPGQDCATTSILCSKATFNELNISGAGTNNRESEGSCLGVESNTAWYSWTAAKSGTLTFIITPNSTTDYIDWVLYDLEPNGNCSKVIPANAIRCATGSGVDYRFKLNRYRFKGAAGM